MTDIDNGLPKATRITQKNHFDYLFSSGKRVENPIVRIQYAAPYLSTPMVAFVATKRQGNAPQRNLSKRLLRELYRLHDLKPMVDMVLIAKPALLKCSFSKLKTDFAALIDMIAQEVPALGVSEGAPSEEPLGTTPLADSLDDDVPSMDFDGV